MTKTTKVSPGRGNGGKHIKASVSKKETTEILRNRAWVEITPAGLRAVAQAGHMRLTLELVGYRGEPTPKAIEELESHMQDAFGTMWESIQGDGMHAWVELVPVLSEP